MGVVTYWIQCLISGEDVTKEGTFIAAISGGITGAFGGIAVSIAVSFAGGAYSEYQDSKDPGRAIAAGVYESIVTALQPGTYTAHVEKKVEKDALKIFSDFFRHQFLDMEKVVFWMVFLENPKNRKIKMDQHLRKIAIPILVLNKVEKKIGKTINPQFQRKCRI